MKKLIISLLLCLGFVSLISGCTSEKSPEEVVNGFLEAFMADDVDGAMSYFADDAVFNAVNMDSVYTGKEDISDYVEFRMRDIVAMELRNFNVDGNQVTWDASLERGHLQQRSATAPPLRAGKFHTWRQIRSLMMDRGIGGK